MADDDGVEEEDAEAGGGRGRGRGRGRDAVEEDGDGPTLTAGTNPAPSAFAAAMAHTCTCTPALPKRVEIRKNQGKKTRGKKGNAQNPLADSMRASVWPENVGARRCTPQENGPRNNENNRSEVEERVSGPTRPGPENPNRGLYFFQRFPSCVPSVRNRDVVGAFLTAPPFAPFAIYSLSPRSPARPSRALLFPVFAGILGFKSEFSRKGFRAPHRKTIPRLQRPIKRRHR